MGKNVHKKNAHKVKSPCGKSPYGKMYEFQIPLPVFQEWWRSLSHSVFHFDHNRSRSNVLFGSNHGPIHSQWCHQNLGHLSHLQVGMINKVLR